MARPTRLVLDRPRLSDAAGLAQLARRSVALHKPWVHLPVTSRGWMPYLERCRDGRTIGYLFRRRDDRELVGVASLSEIVRGLFQSAYLSFYVDALHEGQGFMREGVRAVLGRAFGMHRLHRVEANIQPGNAASVALVKALGFRREGYSVKYLKIGGRWRDHERWALTKEPWRAGRRRSPRG